MGFLSSTALVIMLQRAGAAASKPGSWMKSVCCSIIMLVLVRTASRSSQFPLRKHLTLYSPRMPSRLLTNVLSIPLLMASGSGRSP